MNRLIKGVFLCAMLGLSFGQPAASEEKPVADQDLQVEGRTLRTMARNVYDFFFGTSSDYDYAYDYDFNPNDVSSYTWYNPGSARQDTFDLTENEEEYSWGEMAFGAAMLAAPLALFLALPPGLFTVAIKKRSFSDDNIMDQIDPTELPLLRSLKEGDLLALTRPQCQKKLFCELSQLGRRESATFIQRGFFFLSQMVPDDMAKRMRMYRLFSYTRGNQCEKFTCQAKKGSSEPLSNHLDAPSLDNDF